MTRRDLRKRPRLGLGEIEPANGAHPPANMSAQARRAVEAKTSGAPKSYSVGARIQVPAADMDAVREAERSTEVALRVLGSMRERHLLEEQHALRVLGEARQVLHTVASAAAKKLHLPASDSWTFDTDSGFVERTK